MSELFPLTEGGTSLFFCSLCVPCAVARVLLKGQLVLLESWLFCEFVLEVGIHITPQESCFPETGLSNIADNNSFEL